MTAQQDRVRIAAAQYPIEKLDTLSEYRAKLARWVADAAEKGAELLVFPEYGAMEYAGAAGEHATTLAGSLTAAADAMLEMEATHASLARAYGVHILASSGPCRLGGSSTVNRAKLFAPSGAVGFQDKLMMTPFERNWGISAGRGLSVFATELGRIGIAICYDSEFPLLVRALCEAGAEIILIPSCTEFASGNRRVRTAALARALENGCVTVQSPTIGMAPWSPAVDCNSGAAGIFVPSERGLSDDGILAEGTLGQPQWVHASVDLGRLRRVREAGEMRNARDWSLQPGATSLSHHVTLHTLTD